MRIFVDMDGVLAEWNNVSIEEVTSPGYFRNLLPITPMVEAIKALANKGYDIHILSSVFNDDHSIEEKGKWLDGYLPMIPEEKRLFVPFGVSKTDFIEQKCSSDVLIDDFTKNLNEWHGVGIKCMNGINGTKGTWRGFFLNGRAIPEIIEKTIIGLSQVAA